MQKTMQRPTSVPQKKQQKKARKTPTLVMSVPQNTKMLEKLREGLDHIDITVVETKQLKAQNLAKAHMVVLFGHDEAALKLAWEAGVVPIVKPFNDSIVDYNPNTESGNSFIYEEDNYWDVFAAIVRARETYKFPYDWKFIMRSCKRSA
ncbi:hypothetical protein GF369_01395 [Candidatus Peregrinibacteria bacterium]|nr:hypothetical protein [Candidatus Peregrinibacteria bacterium]